MMAEPLKIDSHMHIYHTRDEGFHQKAGGYVIWEYGEKVDVRFSHYGGDINDALEAIDTGCFSKAVVVNLFANSRARRWVADDEELNLGARLKQYNEWACDLVKPYPQLIPFIAADPGALPGDEGAAHIKEMVEDNGAKGIKLHPVVQGFHMADKRMWPIYLICQELDIPIVVHSGPSRGGQSNAEPRAFAEVLKEFPELKLVLAHMGGGAWQQVAEIASSYPNAFFDCCEILEWTGAPNAPSDLQLARLIQNVGSHRVMMGSDFPWYDLHHSVARVMELPLLSNEEKEGLIGVNAARILGL